VRGRRRCRPCGPERQGRRVEVKPRCRRAACQFILLDHSACSLVSAVGWVERAHWPVCGMERSEIGAHTDTLNQLHPCVASKPNRDGSPRGVTNVIPVTIFAQP
jgi:hypothetical protein